MSTIADLKEEFCRSCQAPVYWIRNDTTGRLAPIDVKPSAYGNIGIVAEGGQLQYHVLGSNDNRSDYAELRTNHFVTCPNSARHHKASTR